MDAPLSKDALLRDSLLRLTTHMRPLRALVDYPKSIGAVRAWIMEHHDTSRLVDEWASEPYKLSLTLRRDISLLPCVKQPTIMFTDDIQTLDDDELFPALNLHGLANLPLTHHNRHFGQIIFGWDQLHTFTEDEKDTLTALVAQSAPVLSMVWTLDYTRRQVLELEFARQESEILRGVAQRLSRARTATELLDAASDYPRLTGATSGLLAYSDESGDRSEVVAHWRGTELANYTFGKFVELNTDEKKDQDGLSLIQPTNQAVMSGAGSRAILQLHNRGRWLGTIEFGWDQAYYFNDRDRALYRAILQQISVVIDSLQLSKETQVRARRTERLLQINTALATATNELQMLNAISTYTALQKADVLTLNYIDPLPDSDELSSEPVAIWIDGEALYHRPGSTVSLAQWGLYKLWQSQPDQVLLIENIATDERLPESAREEMLRSLQMRALALLPLHYGGRVLGVLSVLWFEKHLFSSEERYIYQELCQILSAFTSTRRAYLQEEKARRESEQRAHELATVAKMSAIISSILDVDQLLSKIAELIDENFPDYGIFIYLAEDDDLVRIKPQQDPATPEHPAYRVGLNDERYLMVKAVKTARTYIIDTLRSAVEDGYQLLDMMPGAQAEIVVPMIVADTMIGALVVQATQAHRFQAGDARVFITLAEMIAVAVQNTLLYTQAQQLAVSEERNRLARDLHDSVSQALYGIVLGANTANMLLKKGDIPRLTPAMEYVLTLAQAGLHEIRASIFDLRPVVLETEGLIKAMHGQVSILQQRHGIEVKSVMDTEPELPLMVKENLYRLIREAFHNIVKHAQASQVSFTLTVDDQHVHVEIIDNGVGFDPNGLYEGHLGLKSMRERAAKALRGRLTIDSEPGKGTTIRLDLPVPKVEKTAG